MAEALSRGTPALLKKWTQEDRELNSFALRAFRDVADADYISARLAYRAQLPVQFLWASQQALEKYLKFILFLERVKANDIRHDLGVALARIETKAFSLGLCESSKNFIQRIDRVGRFRYMEASFVVRWPWIVSLDRVVWELRRFCTAEPLPRTLKLVEGQVAPRYRIDSGYLEKVVDERANPCRQYLLWHNGFVGRRRRVVTIQGSFIAVNSPLFVQPELVDRLGELVFIPKEVAKAYQDLARERKKTPTDRPQTGGHGDAP
jgi:hypothetical protein